jgi:hypothetical protein
MFRKAVVARRRQHRDEGFLTTSHCYIPHVKMSKPIQAVVRVPLRNNRFVPKRLFLGRVQKAKLFCLDMYPYIRQMMRLFRNS